MNIAIRVPDELHLKILSFPFLHALNRHFVENLDEEDILNIHLISTKESLGVLNMLPFKAYYQTIPDEDVNNMLAAHLHLGNLTKSVVDIYITLTESFVDTMIGKNLKASKRIGFSTLKNNLLLHKKIPNLAFEHYSQKIFSLLDGLEDCDQKLKRVTSRKLDPLYSNWAQEKYIVLNIEVVDGKLNEEWIDLVNLFENKKIVLMVADFNSAKAKEELSSFISKCSKKNKYEIFNHDEVINFGKLVSYCDCFVSSDSGFIQYAAYCGTQTFHLNREDGEYFDNRYLLGDTVRCSTSDSYYNDAGGFHYGKFFDEIFHYVGGQ